MNLKLEAVSTRIFNALNFELNGIDNVSVIERSNYSLNIVDCLTWHLLSFSLS